MNVGCLSRVLPEPAGRFAHRHIRRSHPSCDDRRRFGDPIQLPTGGSPCRKSEMHRMRPRGIRSRANCGGAWAVARRCSITTVVFDLDALFDGTGNASAARPAVGRNALFQRGEQMFRFDTFGDEAFWGDTLQLHQAIAGATHGGVGPGVSPKTALARRPQGRRRRAARRRSRPRSRRARSTSTTRRRRWRCSS